MSARNVTTEYGEREKRYKLGVGQRIKCSCFLSIESVSAVFAQITTKSNKNAVGEIYLYYRNLSHSKDGVDTTCINALFTFRSLQQHP